MTKLCCDQKNTEEIHNVSHSIQDVIHPVSNLALQTKNTYLKHTHTHTHTYIYWVGKKVRSVFLA